MAKKRKKSKSSPNLPIFMHKSKILENIKTHQVVIITGKTGCGKSTQVPQYLFETGFGVNGVIACLHPRCVAAMSLAERVAYEMHAELGELVGYQVRFNIVKSDKTKILFMTTGSMLMMMRDETFIDKFSVVIIDEAHERSVQTDLMMGLMKEVIQRNKFIRLIIMSATLNVTQIKTYYKNCSIINITNVSDRIKTIYRPLTTENYIEAIKKVVEEILSTSKKGHILIFLQSEEKVLKCKKHLRNLSNTKLLAFFAGMDEWDKQKVFLEYGKTRRKIIIATNVAETSLTIAGVDYVIDSGWVKRIVYDYELAVEKWMTKYVSVAEADQRRGRTGRTGIGTCYRLYEEECVKLGVNEIENQIIQMAIEEKSIINPLKSIINPSKSIIIPLQSINPSESIINPTKSINTSKSIIIPSKSINLLESIIDLSESIINPSKQVERFSEFAEPEINTVNLNAMTLTLKSMKRHDVLQFPFIVAPDKEKIGKALQELEDLSLLNPERELTNIGKIASRLPLEPRLGKVVTVAATELPCWKKVAKIAAMLSVRNVLKVKSGNSNFDDANGDLFRLLRVYDEAKENRFHGEWCQDNGVDRACIRYVDKVYRQLEHNLERISIFSSAAVAARYHGNRNNNWENSVKKVFLAGFFNNIARISEGSNYTSRDGKVLTIHSSSCLDRTDEL